MNKPGVVIATCRPDSYMEWIQAWAEEFKEQNVRLFVMHDSEKGNGGGPEIQRSSAEFFGDHYYLNHTMAFEQLGKHSWIIPQKTSACKSFGIFKAWQIECDPIIVLDDDCLPMKTPLVYHLIKDHGLLLNQTAYSYIYHTIQGLPPRGLPYLNRNPIVLNHGLWGINPDVDAIISLVIGKSNDALTKEATETRPSIVIPFGSLFPMCGMNLAFRREIAPLMYFGLQGPKWGVDRFDDIWCGFIAKKILDYFEMGVTSGEPYVNHMRASDPFVSIVKEAPGYKMNCDFYRFIMRLNLYEMAPVSYLDAMDKISDKMIDWGSETNMEYWQSYGEAIHVWTSLFEGDQTNE